MAKAHRFHRLRGHPGAAGEPTTGEPDGGVPRRHKIRWVVGIAVSSAVTALVGLAVSGILPLWHTLHASPDVAATVERRQVPQPSAPDGAPGPTAPAGSGGSAPLYWDAQVWALPPTADPTSAASTPHLQNTVGADFASTFGDWVTSVGGADVGATHLRITLTGQDSPVVVEGVCAYVVSRAAPQSGTLFFRGPQGNGTPPVSASINLDSSVPCAPEISAAPLTIDPHTSAQVDVTATAHSGTATWYPELHLVSSAVDSLSN